MAKLRILIQQFGPENNKLPAISRFLPNICFLDYTSALCRIEVSVVPKLATTSSCIKSLALIRLPSPRPGED